ncbi:MAG: hypothetical protein V1846_03585 [Candidatus Komeilibacteria bacterium]
MFSVLRHSRLIKFQRLYLFIIGLLFLSGGSFFIAHQAQGVATTLSQTINAGTLAVAIVDADGATVGSPSVTFGAMTYSFSAATTTGTLGASAQRIRVSNPTATAAWTVALAATSGATATWSDGGSNTMDFNDPGYSQDGDDDDTKGGRLAVDPSGGSLSGVSGCSTDNVSLGSSSAFNEGPTNSITIFSSTTAATYCRWDLTGVALTQSVPASQPPATYTLGLTLTAS